jgi:hypothetical protein
MKILAAIKKLFSRKKKDKPIASLKFEVDSAGDIWIDCSWQDQPAANIVFADLMYRVMNGELFGETLTFLKEACEKTEKIDQFIEVWAYLHTMEQPSEDISVSPDDETVVSPTQVMDVFKGKILPGGDDMTV